MGAEIKNARPAVLQKEPNSRFKVIIHICMNNIVLSNRNLIFFPLIVTVLLFTYQYGVPMKESLLCRVLVFFADTPKSAASKNKRKVCGSCPIRRRK